MKKRLFAIILSGLMCFTSVVPAMAEPAEQAQTADNWEEQVQSVNQDQLLQGNITGFLDLPQDYYEFEYKMWLESLQDELPKQVDAIIDDGLDYMSLEIIRWNCLQDYDENLGTYDFEAQFADDVSEKLPEDVAKPVVHVHFIHEGDDGVVTTEYEDYYADIPSVDWGAMEQISAYVIDDGASSLDRYYNGYELGLMPEIRKQSPYGTCWAHAANAVAEIDMIQKGYRNRLAINYSEFHTAYFAYHKYDDPKDCHDNDYSVSADYLEDGGNWVTAYRLMALGVGPVDEGVYPELAYSVVVNNKSAVIDDKYAFGHSDAQITNYYYVNAHNHDDVKKAIIEHGAVSASYKDESAYHSATYNSYFYTGSSTNSNHAIALVGWDDDFPKENFASSTKPNNDGAWLVRNSWGGSGYSKYAYFWISYEDPILTKRGFFETVDTSEDVYDHVYAYDGQCIGLYSGDGLSYYSVRTGGVLKQTFHVDGGESIEAVSLELMSANVHCEVTVSDGVHTSSGVMDTGYSGMYTIVLDEPINVASKTDIVVSIKISSNVGENYVKYSYEAGYGTEDIASADSDFTVDGAKKTRDSRIHLYTNDLLDTNPRIDSVSIVAGGNIGVNFFIDASSLTAEELKTAKVKYKVGDVQRTYDLRSYSTITDNGKTLYKVTVTPVAKRMGDDITIQILDGNGAAYVLDNTGLTNKTEFEYSILKAAEALKAKYPASYDFAVSMIGYGNSAGEYFGTQSTTKSDTVIKQIAGSDSAVEQYLAKRDAVVKSSLHKYSFENMGEPQTPEGLQYLGSSLILENTTAIRHYFKVDSGHSIGEYSFAMKAGGETYLADMVPYGDVYYYELGGFTPLGYDSQFTLAINGDQYRIKYSVNTYLYTVLEKSNSVQLQNLAKAMNVFSTDAKNYFK